eukprot:13242065-Alexandrium_andersonii.AAC.1
MSLCVTAPPKPKGRLGHGGAAGAPILPELRRADLINTLAQSSTLPLPIISPNQGPEQTWRAERGPTGSHPHPARPRGRI